MLTRSTMTLREKEKEFREWKCTLTWDSPSAPFCEEIAWVVTTHSQWPNSPMSQRVGWTHSDVHSTKWLHSNDTACAFFIHNISEAGSEATTFCCSQESALFIRMKDCLNGGQAVHWLSLKALSNSVLHHFWKRLIDLTATAQLHSFC